MLMQKKESGCEFYKELYDKAHRQIVRLIFNVYITHQEVS